MLRAVSILTLAAAFAAAPAHAEILDIRSEATGTGLRILFVFDHQPADASISVSGAEAQATIAGAHGARRLLRPSGGALRQVSVAERPLGLSIGAVADRQILGAEATVFQNAVLFDLTLSTAPGASASAAAPGSGPLLAEAEAAMDSRDAEARALAVQEATQQMAVAALSTGDPLADAALAQALEAAPPLIDTPPASRPPAAAEAAALAEAAAPSEPIVLTPEPAAAPPAQRTAAAEPPRLPEMPEWADDPDAYRMADVPLPRPGAPPGAAAELLAAQFDRVACETAASKVAADPWELDALYNHGACLARDGQTDRAREVFERLQTFDPNSPRALVALGVLRQDAGDRAGAQSLYSRAMANNAGDGLAVLVRMLGEL